MCSGFYSSKAIVFYNNLYYISQQEVCEKSRHMEILVWGDGSISYLDLITICCIHVLNCHAVFHKFIWILCHNLKSIIKLSSIKSIQRQHHDPGCWKRNLSLKMTHPVCYVSLWADVLCGGKCAFLIFSFVSFLSTHYPSGTFPWVPQMSSSIVRNSVRTLRLTTFEKKDVLH